MNFVNSKQSKEERRNKYKMLRERGLNVQNAQRLRDFSMKQIERRIDIFIENQDNISGA